MLLLSLSRVKPKVLSGEETDACARLVIRSSISGKALEDVYFECSTDAADIFSINKIVVNQ